MFHVSLLKPRSDEKHEVVPISPRLTLGEKQDLKCRKALTIGTGTSAMLEEASQSARGKTMSHGEGKLTATIHKSRIWRTRKERRLNNGRPGSGPKHDQAISAGNDIPAMPLHPTANSI